MKEEIRFTHELKSNVIRIYSKKERKVMRRILSEFENIHKMEIIYCKTDNPAIKVEGTMHLYGYKLENGGFFDVVNYKYYNKESDLVRNGTINECKKNLILSKVKIKAKQK